MDYNKNIKQLLRQAKLRAVSESEWVMLSGDGSDRKFYRLGLDSGESCLVVFPSTSISDKQALAESHSAYAIGKHLECNGVSVPHIFAYDEESGGVLFEDLGNNLLYDLVKKDANFPLDSYRQALEEFCQPLSEALNWPIAKIKQAGIPSS